MKRTYAPPPFPEGTLGKQCDRQPSCQSNSISAIWGVSVPSPSHDAAILTNENTDHTYYGRQKWTLTISPSFLLVSHKSPRPSARWPVRCEVLLGLWHRARAWPWWFFEGCARGASCVSSKLTGRCEISHISLRGLIFLWLGRSVSVMLSLMFWLL